MDTNHASLARNTTGLRNYVMLDTYTAGLQLTGSEVKSVRSGRTVLTGSFISLHNGELWLRKCHIPPYQEKNTRKSYVPNRDRKILLRSAEIAKIAMKIRERGFTLIPVEIHNGNGHRLRMTICIAKHATKHDKRQKIKDRDLGRELAREVKGRVSL